MAESVKAFKNKPTDPVQGETPPAKDVSKFHTNADTDGNEAAAHHTLGPGHTQAAPGDHDHRGGNSVPLFDTEITGATVDDAVHSIIALLVELGARDGTTF